MKEIIQKEDPVLRERADEIPAEEITKKETQDLLKEMFRALEAKEHGVALAAPQISVSKRVFVVSPKIFDEEELPKKHLVFINPKITKLSKQTDQLEEGCLSVEGVFGTVLRAQKATVQAYDEHGKKFSVGASGLLAQIFQHEIDHLDGTLYIDKALETHEITPE